MTKIRAISVLLAGLALGCDGQQYVGADTVELVITDAATDKQRVNRCHYVPVLQGSRVVFRYEIESELKATLFVTRDEVRVGFEPSDGTEAFHIDTEDLADMLQPDSGQAPDGFEVSLRPGCEPTNEYR